jgi:hypothetical protein
MNHEFFDDIVTELEKHFALEMETFHMADAARKRVVELMMEGMTDLAKNQPLDIRIATQMLVVSWRAMESGAEKQMRERNILIERTQKNLVELLRTFQQREKQLGLSLHENQLN